MQSSEGAMMRKSDLRAHCARLERSLARATNERDAKINEVNRLGTLLEGYPALEIQLESAFDRVNELLVLLKDAEKRVSDAEQACKVKERVIVELKELRLDTSGRDRKIEGLERRCVSLEAQNAELIRRFARAREVLDGS